MTRRFLRLFAFHQFVFSSPTLKKNMIVHQMDVVTAFLNGTLDEEIYMGKPPGYTQEGKEHQIEEISV